MPGFSNITTVILAGGLGTRLHRSMFDRPKVLAEVLGRPFLTFILDQLVLVGVRDVVLCTGYMADMVQERLGEVYKSLFITYSTERKPLGTGGALRLALLKIKSDTVMVMNGDSYIDVDLNAYLEWFFEKDLTAALMLTKVFDTSRYGRVISTRDGRIKSFEEKGGNARRGWINAGIYLLKKQLVESIPSCKAYSLEREFFPGLIGKGLYGYRCKGRFLDIGTPDSYCRAGVFLSRVCR